MKSKLSNRVFLLSIVVNTLIISSNSYSQQINSNVEIIGTKSNVLTAKSNNIRVSGKLSTGEIIKTGCDHGACYIEIIYKDKSINELIGDDITNLNIYEYDFGNDGDKEIIVVNEFFETTFLFIYSYSRGIIKKIYEKEIFSYKTKIKSNYIENYLPSGIDQVYNYYQGSFWSLTEMKIK